MKGLSESREQASKDDSFLLPPDGGYDISNFVKVDPMFGTNEDLVKLFQEAEKLGIKIILDLVRKIFFLWSNQFDIFLFRCQTTPVTSTIGSRSQPQMKQATKTTTFGVIAHWKMMEVVVTPTTG